MADSYMRIGRIKPLSASDAEETLQATRERLKAESSKDACHPTGFSFDEEGNVELTQPPERFYFGDPDTDIGTIVTAEEMLPPELLSPPQGILGELLNGILDVTLGSKIEPTPWLGVYKEVHQN